MTIEEQTGDFDCTRYTSDVAELANVLWTDVGLAIVLVDAESRLLAFNAAAVPTLGDESVRLGEPLTRRLQHVWLDDEVEECPPERTPLARALAGETTRRQLVRFSTESFEEQGRMRASALPVHLHDGSRGVFLCWQEIVLTQRRDRRQIHRLDQLLEGASDYAIVVLDTDGRVQTWSRSAERLHGYSMVDAIGLVYADLFPEPDRESGIPRKILGAARDTGSTRTESLRLHQDGSMFWAEGALSVLRNETGDVCGYVEVAHCVADRRAAEDEIRSLNTRLQTLNRELENRITERTGQLVRQAADLRSANAELETFSYNVSHNLRAPLRAVGGYARLLTESLGDELPCEALGYLGKLTGSALMMGKLIDGLLGLSRAQRVGLVVEELDMGALVGECWEALSEERACRVIGLTVDDLPPARGDRRLIYQVWMNLLQNAIKYTGTRPKGRISVTAQVRDGVASYRVEDNGVGFDMTYADKIGEVFQRLHSGSEFPGTGVGMASVRQIVLRHGGILTVFGEPEVGATMEFSLWSQR